MLKRITLILWIFCLHSLVSAEDTPEASLKKAKLLCEEKIKAANKELIKANRARKKEIKCSIQEYSEAIQKVKVHFTKQGELQKALSYKELQEELLRQSIYEFIPSDPGKKFEYKETNPPEEQIVIEEPEEFPNEPEEINNQTEEIATQPEEIKDEPEEVVHKPETNNNDTEIGHGNINNFENNTVKDNINIGLGEIIETLSFNEKSLKDYGFSANDSCISGPILEGNESLFISNTTYKFNGKCEYCFKIKARWYHGAALMIDGKVYYISYGNWANNGARIITKGDVEETNNGAKILENEQVLTRLKGKEYKVQRDKQKEWNELKIVIENGNISYLYNGNEIHKDAVDIPNGAQLKFGFSTYRCETELKDFSLKL